MAPTLSWIIPHWIADRLDRRPTVWERPIVLAARLVGADPGRWYNAFWWLTRGRRERALIEHLLMEDLGRRPGESSGTVPKPGLRHACPVCRVPSLPQRGSYEICLVCWWEDDGIVDESWRSDCNRRTLAEARRQFAEGLMAYDQSEDDYGRLGGGSSELEAIKRVLLASAASLRLMDQGPAFDVCRDRLEGLLERLEALTLAKIRDGSLES